MQNSLKQQTIRKQLPLNSMSVQFDPYPTSTELYVRNRTSIPVSDFLFSSRIRLTWPKHWRCRGHHFSSLQSWVETSIENISGTPSKAGSTHQMPANTTIRVKYYFKVLSWPPPVKKSDKNSFCNKHLEVLDVKAKGFLPETILKNGCLRSFLGKSKCLINALFTLPISTHTVYVRLDRKDLIDDI